MSYYPDPETLAANPPETWRVEKRGERLWGLYIDSSHEHPVETFRTKASALAERDLASSRIRREVEKERLWYAGETPYGWKSWAECKAEQERSSARFRERLALAAGVSPESIPPPRQRATGLPEYKKEQWP